MYIFMLYMYLGVALVPARNDGNLIVYLIVILLCHLVIKFKKKLLPPRPPKMVGFSHQEAVCLIL